MIGDSVGAEAGALYVAEDVAAAVRDCLLPLADMATPNAFECTWLAGHAGPDAPDLAALARSLPPPAMLVTSAPALMRGQVGNMLVGEADTHLFEHAHVTTPIKGAGDLAAALLLARRLEGMAWAAAAERALASVADVLAESARAGADELMLPALQEALAAPRTRVAMRRLRG